MKYLDATVSQPDWMMHPMQHFARDSEAVRYEELLAWNVIGSEFGVEHELFYLEADREPYEAELDACESIVWYDLTPIDDDAFYLYVGQETREEDVAWRQAFAALDLLLVPPVVYDEHGDFEITVVGESENIQSMLDDLPGEIDVRVEAIGEYDRRHARVGGELTDRQLVAVRTAEELGFYEVLREATVADVADALDRAPSTASTLLQKAEGSVMTRLVEGRGRR